MSPATFSTLQNFDIDYGLGGDLCTRVFGFGQITPLLKIDRFPGCGQVESGYDRVNTLSIVKICRDTFSTLTAEKKKNNNNNQKKYSKVFPSKGKDLNYNRSKNDCEVFPILCITIETDYSD